MTQPTQVRRTRIWPGIVISLIILMMFPATRDMVLHAAGVILAVAAGALIAVFVFLGGGRGRR